MYFSNQRSPDEGYATYNDERIGNIRKTSVDFNGNIVSIHRALFPVLVMALLTFIGLSPVGAEFPSDTRTDALEPLNEEEMSQVRGSEGLALNMRNWRITGGDVFLNFFENSFTGDPDFSDDHIGIGNFRINSPGQWEENYPSGLSPNCSPYGFTSCGADDEPGITFGTLNDPFTVNVTEYNPADNNQGILAFRWPDNRSNMERVNIGADLHVEADDSYVGNAYTGSNTYLGTLNIVNSLWSGGTQLELSVFPGGGVDVGLDIELDGAGWLRTQPGPISDPSNNKSAYTYADDVYGAETFSGSVDPSSGYTNCCDNSQFTGPLTWASLEGNRPLRIRFNNDQIDIERVFVDNSPSGTIGIGELNMGGSDLGATAVDDLVFDYLRVRAPR